MIFVSLIGMLVVQFGGAAQAAADEPPEDGSTNIVSTLSGGCRIDLVDTNGGTVRILYSQGDVAQRYPKTKRPSNSIVNAMKFATQDNGLLTITHPGLTALPARCS
jgi:hypothetical protein